MNKGQKFVWPVISLFLLALCAFELYLLLDGKAAADERAAQSSAEHRTLTALQEERAEKLQEDNALLEQKLGRKTEELTAELEKVRAELKEAEAAISATPAWQFNTEVGRVYQDPRYDNYSDSGDNYDTRQYTYSMVWSAPTDVVFTGDSLVERCSWEEIYPDLEVKNRAIGGDTIGGLLARVSTIMLTQPKKVFICVGINDVLFARDVDWMAENYARVLDIISEYGCRVYVQSVMPVDGTLSDAERLNTDSSALNERLKEICAERGITYIDLWSEFVNEESYLDMAYHYDGIHVNAAAYKHWKEILDPYVYE